MEERIYARRPGRASLIALNAAGGAAVLGSYAWGLSQPGLGDALWGGVPESVRPLYTANMLLAAAGYFLFSHFVLFRLAPASTRIAGRFGFGLFHLLYALVLVPSALWLPLTAHALASPGPLAWAAVVFDLLLVAIGSLGLLVALATLRPAPARGRRAALLGLLPFCLQTAVLDALVWPAWFHVGAA
jgi:hypothetical protein